MFHILRLIVIAVSLVVAFPQQAHALISAVEEEDGSPSAFPWKLKFTNAALTDNGDGTVSVDTTAGAGSSEWTDTGTILHPNESAADEIAIGGTTEALADIFLGADGIAVFNKQGNDSDFQILDNASAVILHTDAFDGQVGFHTSGPSNLVTIQQDAGSADEALGLNCEEPVDECMTIEANQTTFDVIDIAADSITTGRVIDISADALTTGSGFALASTSAALSTGKLVRFDYAASGDLADRTGESFFIDDSRTHTAANVTSDDYDVMAINRAGTINAAGGTLNAAGSVLRLSNASTVGGAGGTNTDTVQVLEIVQDADSTGDVINVLIGADEVFSVGDTGGESVFNEAQVDIDFRVESNNFANAIFVDANANSVKLGSDSITFGNADGGNQVIAFDGDGGIDGNFQWQPGADIWVWNESGADIDMRWEGDTNTELLFINAASESIGISTVAPSALLDVQQGAVEGKTAFEVDCDDLDQDCIDVDALQQANDVMHLSVNTLTSGHGIVVDNTSSGTLTSSQLIRVNYDADGDSTAKIGNLVQISGNINDTGAGNISQDYDVLNVVRADTSNNAAQTYTAAGSVLRVENQATQTLGAIADSVHVLELVQDTDSSGDGINISMSGAAGSALDIDHDHATVPAIIIDGETTTGTGVQYAYDALTTGQAFRVLSSSADANVRTVVQLTNDHADADSARVLSIKQDGDADAIEIDQNGNGVGIDIQTDATTASAIDINSLNTTGNVIHVTASSLTTGAGVRVYSDSADVLERNLYSAVQDNAAAVGARGLYVGQDSTADGIEIDMNGDGVGLHILHDTTHANATALDIENPDISEFAQASAMEIVYGTDAGVDATNAANASWADPLVYVQTYRDYDAAFNATDDYDLFHIDRQEQLSGGTSTSTGSVMELILDVQDNITTDADILQLVNEAVNPNNTGHSLFINNDVVGNTVVNIDAETTTGTIINVDGTALTTGTGLLITPDALTTGNAVDIITQNNQGITDGRAMRILVNSGVGEGGSAVTANKVNEVFLVQSIRDHDDDVFDADDNFYMVEFESIFNNTGGAADATTSTGATLRVANDVEAGITDTMDVIQVSQDADSTGDGIELDMNGAEAQALFIRGSGTTPDFVSIVGDSLTTGIGLKISVDGLTTGEGLNLQSTSNGGASFGPLFSSDHTVSGTLNNLLANVHNIETDRFYTGGTTADNYTTLYVHNDIGETGGTGHTNAGTKVLRVENNFYLGAANLTDTATVLSVEQTNANSNGDSVFIDHNSTDTGNALEIDSEVTDVETILADASQTTTGDIFKLNFDSVTMTTGTVLQLIDTNGTDHTALEFQDEFMLALDAEGNGTSSFRADGSSGGVLMLRDTDDGGWTECFALNGVLTCGIDADGTPDGAETEAANGNVKEYWWPASATLPLEAADSIPPIAKDAGTSFDQLVVDFDDSTDECRTVSFKVPSDVDTGGTVTFRILWYSAATTTGNAIWDFRHNDGTADNVDPDTLASTETFAADAVPGTAGQISHFAPTVTVTSMNWAANDYVHGAICRDGNNGSDTLANDARLVGFGVEIPRL